MVRHSTYLRACIRAGSKRMGTREWQARRRHPAHAHPHAHLPHTYTLPAGSKCAHECVCVYVCVCVCPEHPGRLPFFKVPQCMHARYPSACMQGTPVHACKVPQCMHARYPSACMQGTPVHMHAGLSGARTQAGCDLSVVWPPLRHLLPLQPGPKALSCHLPRGLPFHRCTALVGRAGPSTTRGGEGGV